MTAAPSQNPQPVTPLWPTPVPFEQELCGLVLDTAPRLFAVVHVSDEGTEVADGWVVAWGIADGEKSACIVSVAGQTQMALTSPECAVHLFAGRPGITARLVWLAAPGAAALDGAEAA
ncbi:hypothetical protein [Kitasatospora viridis]|uniref:Uncharacterized protein n=1 Tax=Kitasatospora viridis TaxID=281105 RepID=A0A561UND6_9ACTN|nr:hypothetical protein [Kitasatospora viridis]TWG00879.1 hypothetical protein FHX73_114759 [Kitasatospora viridis]